MDREQSVCVMTVVKYPMSLCDSRQLKRNKATPNINNIISASITDNKGNKATLRPIPIMSIPKPLAMVTMRKRSTRLSQVDANILLTRGIVNLPRK